MPEYIINILWDNEASVWVAESDDVPGLVLESGSLDALIERIKFASPELLELNGALPDAKSIQLRFTAVRTERLDLDRYL